MNRSLDKYRDLCREVLSEASGADALPRLTPPEWRALLDAFVELVNLTRLTLTDPTQSEELDTLIDHHALALDPACAPIVHALTPEVLARGRQMAEEQRRVDFTDLLWLPEQWQLTPDPYEFLLVDEAQDLNAAQLNLVLRSRAPGGRLLFVGDSRQAIFGFSGADADSFWTIQRTTHAQVLPLSICYRCPRAVVAAAQRIVPEIEAAPNAPEGQVTTISADALLEEIQPGDLILCRLTAPLIEQAIQLIQAQRKAVVLGHSVEKQLTVIVQAVADLDGFTYAQFGA